MQKLDDSDREKLLLDLSILEVSETQLRGNQHEYPQKNCQNQQGSSGIFCVDSPQHFQPDEYSPKGLHSESDLDFVVFDHAAPRVGSFQRSFEPHTPDESLEILSHALEDKNSVSHIDTTQARYMKVLGRESQIWDEIGAVKSVFDPKPQRMLMTDQQHSKQNLNNFLKRISSTDHAEEPAKSRSPRTLPTKLGTSKLASSALMTTASQVQALPKWLQALRGDLAPANPKHQAPSISKSEISSFTARSCQQAAAITPGTVDSVREITSSLKQNLKQLVMMHRPVPNNQGLSQETLRKSPITLSKVLKGQHPGNAGVSPIEIGVTNQARRDSGAIRGKKRDESTLEMGREKGTGFGITSKRDNSKLLSAVSMSTFSEDRMQSKESTISSTRRQGGKKLTSKKGSIGPASKKCNSDSKSGRRMTPEFQVGEFTMHLQDLAKVKKITQPETQTSKSNTRKIKSKSKGKHLMRAGFSQTENQNSEAVKCVMPSFGDALRQRNAMNQNKAEVLVSTADHSGSQPEEGASQPNLAQCSSRKSMKTPTKQALSFPKIFSFEHVEQDIKPSKLLRNCGSKDEYLLQKLKPTVCTQKPEILSTEQPKDSKRKMEVTNPSNVDLTDTPKSAASKSKQRKRIVGITPPAGLKQRHFLAINMLSVVSKHLN
jgi:hypothetical protein